jgi:spore maturation protein CgeB
LGEDVTQFSPFCDRVFDSSDMAMRFLIVDAVERRFLSSLYARNPDYGQLGYEKAWRRQMDECLALADSYSRYLNRLGYHADEVVINDELLQKQWAAEKGLRLSDQVTKSNFVRHQIKGFWRKWSDSPTPSVRKLYDASQRFFYRIVPRTPTEPWVYEILAAQIEEARPDVLYNHAIWALDKNFLERVRPFVKVVVGQHASPLPANVPYQSYDLILSSLPNLVNHFRRQGVESRYFRLGFDPTFLNRLRCSANAYSVVHVGSYGSFHKERNKLLEEVASQVRVDFWGFGVQSLSRHSPIVSGYHGEAWGIDKLSILYNSQIALTKHITSVAGRYANNMTLYEATGVGTLLITDAKENLEDLFQVGKEVVAYHDARECVELVKYYLEHEDERIAIAKSGQRRTLQEHSYENRMRELVEIVGKYLP